MPLTAWPRTCNADVLELARYWTEQLSRIGAHAYDTHTRILYARWPEVVLAVTEPACVLDVGHSAVQEAGDLEVVVGWGSVDTSGGRMGHALQSMRIMCQCHRLAILLYCG